MLQLLGPLHPALVHFPVALLMAAAFFEIAAWLRRDESLHLAGAWNLALGAPASVVTALSGWALASTMGFEPELKATLAWHRWLGTALAAWAIVCLALWAWQRKAGHGRWAYRLALLGGAVLVAITGHLGGILVYGPDFLK